MEKMLKVYQKNHNCLHKWHQTFMNLNLFNWTSSICQTPALDCPQLFCCSPSMGLTSLLPQHSCPPSLTTTVLQFLLSSSLTSSDKLYLSLSPSVLPLLISTGAPEVYKCSSASLQYELIPNLAARRSEGKIDTKTQFAKTSRGMQNKILLSQKHL